MTRRIKYSKGFKESLLSLVERKPPKSISKFEEKMKVFQGAIRKWRREKRLREKL